MANPNNEFKLLNGLNLTVNIENPDHKTKFLNIVDAETLQEALSKIELIAIKSENNTLGEVHVTYPLDLLVNITPKLDGRKHIEMTPKSQIIGRLMLRSEGQINCDIYLDSVCAEYETTSFIIHRYPQEKAKKN